MKDIQAINNTIKKLENERKAINNQIMTKQSLRELDENTRQLSMITGFCTQTVKSIYK